MGDLLLPHTGTIFWMLIAFGLVFILLKKFAWKPILSALKQRESSIEDALLSAESARNEIRDLRADNEKVLDEAKLERDEILKEARNLKEEIINEAKVKATEEADRIIQSAGDKIRSEKALAVKEIKEQIASLSITIAEKILEEKLESNSEQQGLIDKYLQNIKLN